jgi:hypothetical protein
MPPFIPHPAPLPLGEGIENLALHHVQKVPMHGQVAASFGVKRRHQNVTLEQARGDVAPATGPTGSRISTGGLSVPFGPLLVRLLRELLLHAGALPTPLCRC